MLYIDNDMRFTTRSNNSSTVQYTVHVVRLTQETVEEYVSVKNEVGYKFSTVSLQWYQTGYMGQDKYKWQRQRQAAFTANNKQNKPY